MPHSDVQPDGGAPGAVSRRTVLRAGAWAAPVIVLAAGVPAASASLNKELWFTNFSLWYDWNSSGQRTAIAGNTTVGLRGDPTAITTLVTVVITVPAAGMSETATIDDPLTNWVFVEAALSEDSQSMTYTFTWTGTLLPDKFTSMLCFHLQASGTLPPGSRTWSAVGIADGATNATWEGGLATLNPTALSTELTVPELGTLTAVGATLVWSGAEVRYDGTAATAHVPYFVTLLRDDVLIASLSGASVDVSDGETVPIPTAIYRDPLPGVYQVDIYLVATDSVVRHVGVTRTVP